jgi:hypothetical protein
MSGQRGERLRCTGPRLPLCFASHNQVRSQQDRPMPTTGLAPLDETITIEQLTRDPRSTGG